MARWSGEALMRRFKVEELKREGRGEKERDPNGNGGLGKHRGYHFSRSFGLEQTSFFAFFACPFPLNCLAAPRAKLILSLGDSILVFVKSDCRVCFDEVDVDFVSKKFSDVVDTVPLEKSACHR